MMPPLDYLKYYDLERYLFDDVHEHFRKDCSIGAFDFFSIVIWKANRAKSKIAHNLMGKHALPGESDLESIVRRLTKSLYVASDHRERLRLLLKDWGFRLPMASAILTVLWPEDFTVYDTRVCEQIKRFHGMADWTDFDRLWKGYNEYKNEVIGAAPNALSLRDKDRYLWARSAAEQLREDIKKGFPTRDSSAS